VKSIRGVFIGYLVVILVGIVYASAIGLLGR
jgi:hypothetical protein